MRRIGGRSTVKVLAARAVGIFALLGVLASCGSPPKPPEPSGQWIPVNPTAGSVVSAQQR
jgi:hypothetical protein